MKEILGGNLEKPFAFYEIEGKKTYEGKTYTDEKTQVWEISEADLEKLLAISDEEWEANGFLFCWWRYSTGSVLGNSTSRFNINGHYLTAFNGYHREEAENNGEEFWVDRKYSALDEYLCEEIRISAERNVAAVAADLAKMNGLTLAQLYAKFQS